jgi:hypothetical protein
MESYDLTNQQWAIRTWNSRHLAINSTGHLVVEVLIYSQT